MFSTFRNLALLLAPGACWAQYVPPGGGASAPTNISTLASNTLDFWFNECSGTNVVDHSPAQQGGPGTFNTSTHAPTWNSDCSGISVNAQTPGFGQNVTFPVGTWQAHKTAIIAYKADVNALKTHVNKNGTIAASDVNTIQYLVDAPTLLPMIGNAGTIITDPNYPSIGNTITTWVLQNPCLIYQFGTPSPAYGVATCTSTSAPAGGTIASIGDCGGCPGGASGFDGQIYHFALYSAVLTQAQIAVEVARIRAIQATKGVTFQETPIPYTGHMVISGDSIPYGNGVDGVGNSGQNFVELTRGVLQGIGIDNVSYAGINFSAIPNNVWCTNITRSDGVRTIAAEMAGTNDINGGQTATQVYTTAKAWVTAMQNCGASATIVTTVLSRSGVDAGRATYNACLRDGFLGTNAGCGGGQIPASAVVWWGFDPNMGQTGQFSTSWYFDAVHPGVAGNAMGAAYWEPAIQRATGLGAVPVNVRITLSNNAATNWTLAFNGTTAGPGPAIAAATSQSIPIYYLGPKMILCGDIAIKSTTQFSATSLTTLQTTIGDTSSATFYTSGQYNLMTAPGVTNIQHNAINKGPSWAGSNVTIELNGANQNLNAQANLAGAVDVTLPICSIP